MKVSGGQKGITPPRSAYVADPSAHDNASGGLRCKKSCKKNVRKGLGCGGAGLAHANFARCAAVTRRVCPREHFIVAGSVESVRQPIRQRDVELALAIV